MNKRRDTLEFQLKSEEICLVDSHCHLDLEHFDSDRSEVIARAQEAGVVAIVNPGIDLDHSRKAIELSEADPSIFAAVGVHPLHSDRYSEAVGEELRSLCRNPRVVAFGEIGLDYHWKSVTPEVQASALRAQLRIAAEEGLPVIIHNREASTDLASILDEWVKSPEFLRSPLAKAPFAGVLHAFGAEPELANQAYEWNFALGLGGPVTFRNARALQEMVPRLRLDRILIETDAPYLTPHPFRGKRNEPGRVRLVAEKVAELFGSSLLEIGRVTSANAFRFFGLD